MSLNSPFVGHMDDDDSIVQLPDTFPSKLTNRVMACMSYQPERRPDAHDILRSIKWHKAELEHSPNSGPVNSKSGKITNSVCLKPESEQYSTLTTESGSFNSEQSRSVEGYVSANTDDTPLQPSDRGSSPRISKKKFSIRTLFGGGKQGYLTSPPITTPGPRLGKQQSIESSSLPEHVIESEFRRKLGEEPVSPESYYQ